MKSEAFVYGWKNIENGKMYVGYHKSKEINDGYVFSSENLELREAWSYGKMRRSILHKGSASECITMERAILKKFDARRTDQWYNGTNGGGEGLGDWKSISDEDMAVAIDWVNGIDPEEEKVDLHENVGDGVSVYSIVENIKARRVYDIKKIPVEEIQTYKNNQVRTTMYNHNKIKDIVERMRENPGQSRGIVAPIVVCVNEDKENVIIDGNHTANAVVSAGWTHADVVFLNFSEFGNKKFNIDQFGSWMNHDPVIKEGNRPEDCRSRIVNLYAAEFEDIDVDFKILESTKFKNTCLKHFAESPNSTTTSLWTKRQVVSNLKSAIKAIKTKDAAARLNFQAYSKSELEKIRKEYVANNPDRSVIVISSSNCFNSGIGGIMNKIQAEQPDHEEQKGTIIIHHGDIHQYYSEQGSIKNLEGTLKLLKGTVDVDYIVLDAFTR